MRFILRPANLFLLSTYLVLSAGPFLPSLFGRDVADPWRMLGMEVVAWLALWAVAKRPAYFHWLLLPSFLALPMEIYLNAYYGQGISSHHLGIIAETSPKEAMEFLGNKVWGLGAVFVGILAWWLGSGVLACKTRELDWKDGSRWVALALLGLAASVWVYGDNMGIASSPTAGKASVVRMVSAGSGEASEEDENEDDDNADASGASLASAVAKAHPLYPKLPAWAKVPFEIDAFGKTWPFGIAVRVHDFWKERKYLAELSERSAAFRFGARAANDDEGAQVVVMVIGESSRFDRWSLNGYGRETNPLLKQEANVVSLADMVTAVSATRLSVPVLVSRKPARKSLQAGFSEKSFLTAFKEAGFKTWWLSNQMSFGQFDTPISVFAKEADVVQFLNLGGFTNQSSYDDVLLAPLRAALREPARKKLIVLHTLGSHWNYSHRYPQEFDKWQPSLFGIANPAYTNANMKPQINNSYDNSILYTDWLLSQVINTLKSPGQKASLMYVADHGQTLYDGTCSLAFHGHNTQHEFHVPSLVWYSDAYAESHPDKVRQLLHHKRTRLSTENVFHSLLDMAAIQYPGEQPEWSFFNAKFKTHKRYVDSYGWSNYDNATFKGDCREVIDKGKPLVQEK
ncbi:phosphoethanolamine transferase [Noviherbaspirillum galbum]|uniref:Phosphoethanolamine transferase n=1 Tax=Noviherbaspirillum galbum TaxID=2709383 RepID=A0A6B3SXF4_9BURK|nr:phosphoethanolamine transferase [Noviherbaspirillum galbum]NEX62439.1 phosphoethanolamine transferase [Noviherbaspirillum galbum]